MSDPAKNPRQWVPACIRHDFWRKLVALFLALLLYLALGSRSRNEDRVEHVPVQIRLPGALVLEGDATPTITVWVTGSASQLARWNRKNIRVSAEVTAAEFQEGEPYILPLRSQDVEGLPFGLRVRELVPRELRLNLDRVETKRVPVRERFDSRSLLPLGYDVGEVKFTPAEISVSGPARVIRDVKEIYTMPIPLDRRVREGFDFQARLNVPPGLSTDRDKVHVQVEIIQAITSHIFHGIPILTMQTATGKAAALKVKKVTPPELSVTVNGTQASLSMMRNDELKAYLDLGKITAPGEYKVGVKVVLDSHRPDVTIRRITPVSVDVEMIQE